MGSEYLWEFLGVNDDLTIVDSFVKADSIINSPLYSSILCSISGGADSDIMLDLISKVDKENKVKYIWFNTGLEYQATKDHLKYLEDKYKIDIIRERPEKPIPLAVKEYGLPFKNKYVSNMISRLQKYNFTWQDKPYEELIKEYPKCISAVKWWTNQYTKENNFEKVSRYDINYNKYLKEFLIAHPPNFKISDKCCLYTKKKLAKKALKKYNADLNIYGVRRSEGGVRATAYKNCFSIKDDGVDDYRPIYWYDNNNKLNYEKKFNIIHSNCYLKYGFTRTGCCCCPYSRDLEYELKIISIKEPLLYKAVCNVFKDSYEYTRKYKEFVENMKFIESKENTELKGQSTIFDYIEV